MTPERHEEIDRLCRNALDLNPVQRAAFLATACKGDEALREEVVSLLGYQSQVSDLLDQLAMEVAAHSLAAEQGDRLAEIPLTQQLGRYWLRTLLGQGGMGDVWLADDVQLGRQVAVKILPAEFTTDADRVRRFEREARAASALNHPNILTIHEIGVLVTTTGDTHYIVTELVQGITLRQHMAATPNHRMPLVEALRLAAQLTEALSAAHEAGIIHRDIKPENVMVRRDGYVKVLDFGLAKLTEKQDSDRVTGRRGNDETLIATASTAAGIVMGTPRYMSPEQACGEKVDVRTDLFSLGVMLYEMVAGHAPFVGATPSEVVGSILRDDPLPLTLTTPLEVKRIIQRSLQKKRADRYQTAEELLTDLKQVRRQVESTEGAPEGLLPSPINDRNDLDKTSGLLKPKTLSQMISTSARRKGWHNSKTIVGCALAGIVILAAAFYYYHRPPTPASPTLTNKVTILLADFENQTSDEIFDGMLKQGVAIQLQQTPFLLLLPETRMRHQLTLMKRQPNERVTAELAHEICVRENLKAFITGSIASLGNHYVITLAALNGQSGVEMVRVQDQAINKEQVLLTLSRAATRLRERLGESVSSLQQFSYHFEEATSAKLEAFKFYAVGAQQSISGGGPAVFPSLRRAVELDPDFALAHTVLAIAYHFTGRPELAAKSAERAYVLKDRVSEYEKLRITNWYHALVTGDLDMRLEALALEKQMFPGKWAAGPADTAHSYNLHGQFELALVESREAIRLDPQFAAPYMILARALIGLNRFAEARDTLTQALQLKLDTPEFHSLLYQLAFIERDAAEMQRQVEVMRAWSPLDYMALDWQSGTATFTGQWRIAQAFARQAIERSARSDTTEAAAQYATEQALRGAVFEDCRQARVSAVQGLKFGRGRVALSRAALALALCGEVNQAKLLADEMATRYPADTHINSIWLPAVRAALSLKQGNAALAILALQATTRYESATEFWPQYLRGQAYLQLKQGAEAGAEFQKILDHRGYAPLSPLYPLAHLGLERAAVLTNNTAQIRNAYEAFLTMWKDADVDLPILIEAKRKSKLLHKR